MRCLPALVALLLTGCAPIPRPSVVTLGDSVPAGTACGCDPFPARYAQAQHAIDVNLAEPGSTAADLRAAVPGERDVLAAATEVVIMTGANDLAGSFDDPARYGPVTAGVEADVVAAVAAIERIHRVPVIILGYWNVVRDGRVGAAAYGPAGVAAAARATAELNRALQAAADASGARFVATLAAFHGPGGDRDPTGLLAPDGDHPDAAGHAAIAALLPPLAAAGPRTE
ncbi:SGNH/GDSL hydrolase family protein [Paractinoplanes toevensis]|uniref:SGNH/GDSL hydrolase family protein n=1 Tax=Paractinoplanes toevensis TaxID=571911 RepID=UPI001BB4526A|nr:SGNH/GDSL hydrolase family protein [Actinoplanes toevensis]